jgi:hypothetical protein
MVMHAVSGGRLEVMGVLQGKIEGKIENDDSICVCSSYLCISRRYDDCNGLICVASGRVSVFQR